MAIVQKAGAIVLGEKNPSLIALLYRSKQNDWSFPKGHVEKGESVAETTRREVAEETGLPVRMVGDTLPPMEYDHPKGDRIVVHMFLMQSEDDSKLNPEFEGDKIVWVKASEVGGRLSYDNIKEYYAAVYGAVEKTISGLQPKTR